MKSGEVMKMKPAHIILAAVLIVVAVLAVPRFLADAPGSKSTQGTVVTETIAVVDTNATVTYPMSMVEGNDAEHELGHVVEALTGIRGVGKASLDTQSLELTVLYDGAVIGDAPIQQALAGAGYIAPTTDAAAPTDVAEDGAVQRIAVGDDGTGFDPSVIAAKAGIPLEIEFAPGQECRTVVKFPEIGVEEEIGQGGTVKLPALEAGTYQIVCGGDGPEGTLLVE
jgi:copper chaperone CopZ